MTVIFTRPPVASGILLFGPGAGGDPSRYQPLLDAASESGFIVVAPVHERFDGRTVTDEQMCQRAHGMATALAEVERTDLPVVAAGHSAGGWAALCLAGAQPWGRDRQPLEVPNDPRVSRVVLLAPTLGWFQAPGALDQVETPVTALVGESDRITPPATADVLRAAPGHCEIHAYEGVGHFDFMSQLPPGIEPTMGLDHEAFLAQLARDFVAALG